MHTPHLKSPPPLVATTATTTLEPTATALVATAPCITALPPKLSAVILVSPSPLVAPPSTATIEAPPAVVVMIATPPSTATPEAAAASVATPIAPPVPPSHALPELHAFVPFVSVLLGGVPWSLSNPHLCEGVHACRGQGVTIWVPIQSRNILVVGRLHHATGFVLPHSPEAQPAIVVSGCKHSLVEWVPPDGAGVTQLGAVEQLQLLQRAQVVQPHRLVPTGSQQPLAVLVPLHCTDLLTVISVLMHLLPLPGVPQLYCFVPGARGNEGREGVPIHRLHVVCVIAHALLLPGSGKVPHSHSLVVATGGEFGVGG